MTRFAIERNRVTLVLLAVALVAGLQSYLAMPQAEDPGFTIRRALVQTSFPGASPERVEELVTDKLEEAIQEIPQLEAVRSQSKNGVSLIFVEIQERYQEMRPIWDDLRRKVERVEPDLPDGIIGPFVNDEFGDVYGSVITLTGDGFDLTELKDTADEVRDELLLIEDASKVAIYGAQDERVFVEYSNAKLAELGLSPGQLIGLLDSRNIINPGGELRTPYEQIVIEPTGNFVSVEDLRSTLIPLPGTGELVSLGELAEVRRGTIDPPRSKVHSSGVPGLALAVAMRDGGNIVDLGRQIREVLTRLEAQYPIGVDFDIVIFQADAVEKKVDDFVMNLVQAVVIVMAVMLLTLGLRTGLVVASLIPSAIIITFLFLPMAGVGIDQMSLAALIIALGLLVDNAIVVSESIIVRMQAGEDRIEAAVRSAAELRIPLLTSSLTTAAAFLPIFLAKSAVGEYTGALFKVVTTTLLCSWVLSLTVIPLFCVLFLKIKAQAASEESFDGRFYALYRAILLGALRRRGVTLLAVVLIFFGSLQLFALVPSIFFPPNDRATLTVELELPIGTPIERTEKIVTRVEQYLDGELRDIGVTDWVTYIGEGGPRFYLSYGPEQSNPGYAILVVNTATREATDAVVAPLQAFCDSTFPGLKTTIAPLQSGPSVSSPIQVRIAGRDRDKVFQLVDRVKAKIRTLSGPINVADNWGARSKKLIIDIDEARARRAGVTHQDVAISLQTLFSGLTATEYREGTDIIPVTLRSDQARQLAPQRLASINVFSQSTGQSVPVTQVADARLAWQPSNIQRRNRLQTVTVEAGLQPGVTAAEVNAQLTPWLEEESADWPVGYTWELGGEAEASGNANQSIADQLPTAGMLIVLLLVAQFNSLRKPAIILLTIPLGIIGVVIGLLVLRSYFGFMTLLGIVSLAGIVINNAIVLLDRIQIELDENGLTPQQAIIEAGQRRLRPILLTTATTLGGMIPLYLGGGAMFEPMAVAIMFGLVFATGLTLGVVPLLYALFYRVSYKDFTFEDPSPGDLGPKDLEPAAAS